LKAMGLTITMAVVGTTVIALAVKAVIGLRPDREDEEDGLDQLDHGEAGYHFDEGGGHSQSHAEEEMEAIAGAAVAGRTAHE
jgi:hypothetical protein